MDLNIFFSNVLHINDPFCSRFGFQYDDFSSWGLHVVRYVSSSEVEKWITQCLDTLDQNQ